MQLFYCPDINPNQIFTLGKEESQHLIKVLRQKEGDKVHLTDGKGNLFEADILEANPRACIVKIVNTKEEYNKRDYYLHIAIAPTKNISRIEWFLEKATEIGIDEITPIICQHSERDVLKHERLEKIIISAMKQSLKAYMPKLNSPTPLLQVINNSTEKNKLIGYCIGDNRNQIKDIYKPKESVLIVIGPEGDFSEKEVEEAIKNNFQTITLGKERLRTETAGIYVVNIIHSLNQ
ncbi:MAG: 16S rRNA (uracil(1498)-N(3))-methyltransferase [Bacteroidales bacterium]|nr:16S rRNA (uracil(1498)-N(3))-methyltransferase [Bacteroidales bacterium]